MLSLKLICSLTQFVSFKNCNASHEQFKVQIYQITQPYKIQGFHFYNIMSNRHC